MNRFYQLALKNIWTRRARSALVFATVALGVSMIVSTGVALTGVDIVIRCSLERHIGDSHLVVTRRAQGTYVDEEAYLKIRDFDGVVKAAPGTIWVVMGHRDGEMYDEDTGRPKFILFPINSWTFRENPNERVVEGRPLEPGETGAVLMSSAYAREKGYAPGDVLDLVFRHGDADVEGEMNARVEIAGLYEGKSRRIGSIAATWEGIKDIYPGIENMIEEVKIATGGGRPVDEVRVGLERELGDKYLVMSAGDYARAEVVVPLIRITKLVLAALAFATLLVGAHIVSSIFSISISERVREIGLLRSVGATRTQVLLLLLAEGAAFGLIGSLIGVPLGLALAKVMLVVTEMTFFISGAPYTLPPGWIAAGFLSGLAVTIVSMLFPAVRAARLSPVDAIRTGISPPLQAGRRAALAPAAGVLLVACCCVLTFLPAGPGTTFPYVCAALATGFAGMLLLVPALVPALSAGMAGLFSRLFGGDGFIAARNLDWNRHRTATAVSVVFSSVVIIMLVSGGESLFFRGFDGYIEQTMGADLFFYSNGMKPEEIEALRDMDAVDEISYMHSKYMHIQGNKEYTVFVKPREYLRLSSIPMKEGDMEKAVEMIEAGDAMIVTTDFSIKEKVGPGDTVAIETEKGTVDFTVAGVAYMWSNLMSWDDGAKYFGYTDADKLLVRLKDGADVGESKREIRKALEEKGFAGFAQGIKEMKESMRKETAQAMYSLKASLLVVVAIAVMAIFNTMYAASLERTRETGVVRALGLTKKRVAGIMLMEAVAASAAGLVLGLAFSIFQMVTLARGIQYFLGLRMPFFVPAGPAATVCGIVLVVALAGGIAPARRTARMQISESLKYE